VPVGQTVVPYATFQEAFQSNPDQMNNAVQAAATQAAGGDPDEKQRLIAAWHNAIGVLSQDAKPVLKRGGPRQRHPAHTAERPGFPIANTLGEASNRVGRWNTSIVEEAH
jgi:hypothetical protein